MEKAHTFKPGNKFGKGRPVGSKNNAQVFLEKLSSENAEAILNKAIEQALSGDLAAMKLVLDRAIPVPKARTYVESKSLKNLRTHTDTNEAMTDLLDQIGDGEISVDDGLQVAKLIEVKSNSITQCLQAEIDSIKKTLGLI